MLQNNPYSVLAETISFENMQQIGEMITLKALRGLSQYPHACYQQLYLSYIQDLNRLSCIYVFRCLRPCTNSHLFLV